MKKAASAGMASHLERIPRFSFTDQHGGEPANASNKPEPVFNSESKPEWEEEPVRNSKTNDNDSDDSGSDEDLTKLARVASTIFSHLAVLLIGGLIVWYLFPRPLLVPVPVDPQNRPPSEGVYGPQLPQFPFPDSAPAAAPAPGNSPAPASPDASKPQTKRNDAHP